MSDKRQTLVDKRQRLRFFNGGSSLHFMSVMR